MQIWDVACGDVTERSEFRGSDAAIITFPIDKEDGVANARFYLQSIRREAPYRANPNYSAVLLATKSDEGRYRVIEEYYKKNIAKAKSLATEYKVPFYRCSAKDNTVHGSDDKLMNFDIFFKQFVANMPQVKAQVANKKEQKILSGKIDQEAAQLGKELKSIIPKCAQFYKELNENKGLGILQKMFLSSTLIGFKQSLDKAQLFLSEAKHLEPNDTLEYRRTQQCLLGIQSLNKDLYNHYYLTLSKLIRFQQLPTEFQISFAKQNPEFLTADINKYVRNQILKPLNPDREKALKEAVQIYNFLYQVLVSETDPSIKDRLRRIEPLVTLITLNELQRVLKTFALVEVAGGYLGLFRLPKPKNNSSIIEEQTVPSP